MLDERSARERCFALLGFATLLTGCGGGRSSLGNGNVQPLDGGVVYDASSTSQALPDAHVTCPTGDSFGDPVGSLDNQPLRIRGMTGGSNGGYPELQPSWATLRTYTGSNAILAWSQEGNDGGASIVGGLVALANPTETAWSYYCTTDVQTTLLSDDAGHAVEVRLSDFSRLGNCPGVPAAGEVQVCLGQYGADGGAQGCPSRIDISGQIDGVTIGFEYIDGDVYLGPEGVGAALSDWLGGVVIIHTGQDGSIAGWFRLSDGPAPGAGTVFCLDHGHASRIGDRQYAVTFDTVSRAGACPGTPIQGEVGFCW